MKEPFNTKVSVFKNLFNAKDTPFSLTITDVYERIKIGNPVLIDKINIIRTSPDKDLLTPRNNVLTHKNYLF